MEKRPARKTPQGAEGIAYQGRRAARQGSEQRRRAILEAALRIIVRDGVRAVRHRAVAKEAGVPLSATTYYFKDIGDLIADTFTLFVENARQQVLDPIWLEIYQFTSRYQPAQLTDMDLRRELVAGLSKLAADFLEREITTQRAHLMAEQAFLQAAVLDERLRAPAALFRQGILDGLQTFCTLLATPAPAMDAEMIHATFTQLEYEHLLMPPGHFDRARVEQVLSHRFGLLLYKPA